MKASLSAGTRAANTSKSSAIFMPTKTTLLITAPPPGLLVDLARRRPDWCVLEIGDAPPPEAIDGRVWGFIDWLCPSLS
ncbi:hypothetical protein, partial [Novosphingobium sp.]|uniref:hypothetical protein n=1 Tax=Novosphingobium sp. TaxID=1874826 RepID=UPI00286DAF55